MISPPVAAIMASTVMLPETSLQESVQMGHRVEALIQELTEHALEAVLTKRPKGVVLSPNAGVPIEIDITRSADSRSAPYPFRARVGPAANK